MKRGQLIKRIIGSIDNISFSEFEEMELEHYCELLNNSQILNNLLKQLIDLNIECIKGGDVESISSNYIIRMFAMAYCINNNISCEIYNDSSRKVVNDVNREINKYLDKYNGENKDLLMCRDSVACYLTYLSTCPEPITDLMEQGEIIKKIRAGDKDAWEYFVLANLKLVYFHAKKYVRNGSVIDLLDNVQEGVFGLFEAIENFDLERKTLFSTYASWKIRQKIIRAVEEKQRSVRIPVYLVESSNKIKKIMESFEKKNGREPSIEEVASIYGTSVEKIKNILDNTRDINSLDEHVRSSVDLSDMIETKMDYLVDETVSIEDEIVDKVWVEDLQKVMSELINKDNLSDREYEVIIRRFGFNGREEESLAKIGRSYDVTREMIRQNQNKVLKRLRNINKVKRIAKDVCFY